MRSIVWKNFGACQHNFATLRDFTDRYESHNYAGFFSCFREVTKNELSILTYRPKSVHDRCVSNLLVACLCYPVAFLVFLWVKGLFSYD